MVRSRFPIHRPLLDEIPYHFIVSEWDESRQETGAILALTNNGAIAAAAFDAACQQRSGPVVLCNGSRIVSRSKPVTD